MTSRIFSAIRHLSQDPDRNLLIYVKDLEPEAEFVNLLASLHEVDFILVNGESLRSLCLKVIPHEIYEVEGAALHKHEDTMSLFYSER